MLNGGINRSHAGTYDHESNGCHDVPGERQQNQQNAKQFHDDADADQQLVPKLIGNKAGNQSAQHQATENQGTEGSNGFCAQASLCPCKIAGHPQEAGGLAGAVGKEGNQRQHNSRHLQRLGNAGTFAIRLLCLTFGLFPQGQRKNAHQQNAKLNIGRPPVAFIPPGKGQCLGHDVGADHRTDAVEAVQEIHDRRGIVIRNIVVDRGVNAPCTEAIGNSHQEQHPVLGGE